MSAASCAAIAPSTSPLSASFTPRWTLARASSLSALTAARTVSSSAGQRGPYLRVPRERTLRLVPASKSTIGKRERILRRAPFRKQRDRALQVRDGRVVEPPGRVDAAQSEFGRRLGGRLPNQRLEQPLALVEVAGFEQRFRELHPRRQVVRRRRECLAEPRGRLGMPREALQDDRIQVRPLEGARRERLRARVRLVGAVPLLPRMEHSAERADRFGVRGSSGGVAVRARNRLTRRSRVGVERQTRQGRRGGLRERQDNDTRTQEPV